MAANSGSASGLAFGEYSMKARRPAIFASLVGVAVILCVTAYARYRPVYDWLSFSAWKLIEAKGHGGQYFDVKDASIYYETYGAGPPVLVLHGGLGSIESMSHQIEALAKSHLVIAVDSRGHGRSTDSNTQLSYKVMADDMSNLLDHLQIDRADVVGWSDGGIIGLDLAMRYPQRVRRLVAIGANYDVDGLKDSHLDESKAPKAPLTYRLFLRNSASWPALYRKVITMWKTQPHYSLDDLSHIKAPTLIMAGQFDIIKPEHTAQLAKAISGSQEITIPNATHSGPIDKPEIVNTNILKFLDGQSGGRAE